MYTWDGKRVLQFSTAARVPYTVYKVPNEHADELPGMTSAVTDGLEGRETGAHPKIDATTFSTQPPAGAKVQVIP